MAGGTLVPPKMDTFSLSAGVNADLSGTLKFAGSASVCCFVRSNEYGWFIIFQDKPP